MSGVMSRSASSSGFKRQRPKPPWLKVSSDATIGDWETTIREQFAKFDVDNSGYLDRKECAEALRTLGSKLTFDDLDKDGDERISADEFTVLTAIAGTHSHSIFKSTVPEACGKVGGAQAFAGSAHLNETFAVQAADAWRKVGVYARQAGFTKEAIVSAFRRIDEDNSGSLSVAEIRKAMKTLAPQLTEVDLTLMVTCADTDADGDISEKEFVRMMMLNKESDVNYWEKYGQRDMHIGLADRTHQIRY